MKPAPAPVPEPVAADNPPAQLAPGAAPSVAPIESTETTEALPAENNEGADWAALLEQLPARGILKSILLNSFLVRRKTDTWVLEVDENQQGVFNSGHIERVAGILSEHFGRKIQLEMSIGALSGPTPAQLQQARQVARQKAAEAAIAGDAHVQWCIEQFDAVIRPDSIYPKEEKPE